MAAFTKEGTKKALAAAWGTLTGIPQTVLDIAALGDPGARRFVVWNDATNHLDYLDLTATEVPYDNSGSGLTSTDVQGALDELAAMITFGAQYTGYVGADGSTGNRLPAGWSAAKTATGTYEVTHSLGLADLTRLALVPACIGSAGNKAIQTRTSSTGNKVVIETVDSGTGTLTDEAFCFVAGLT